MSKGPRLPKDETLPQALTRLMTRVNKTATCWLWTGLKWTTGYARCWYQGRDIPGHRLVYWATFGDIPEGLQVCHKCDTPLCVRPDHLFLGTPKENVHDAIQKGRWMTPHKRYVSAHCHRPQARLTPEQVREIRRLFKPTPKGKRDSKTSCAFLSKKFGVHHTTIFAIIRGRAWKSIT